MKEKGFSLIETAIAVLVFVLIAEGILSVFLQGEKQLRASLNKTIAYNLVREKLEEKISQTSPSNEPRSAVSNFSGFERQVAISYGNVYGMNILCIRATVWWDQGARQVSIETQKSDY